MIAIFSSLLAALLLNAPDSYRIAGEVVDHRTQTPVASALVSIIPVRKGEDAALDVLTDAQGHFQFVNLAAGKYALNARRRGESPQALHAHGMFSTAIAAGPGLDSEHVVFPLIAESRITGVVVDDDGDPVSAAQLFLIGKQVVNGKAAVQQQGQQNTSASGAFHFGHLKPGTYFIAVSARPWYASRHSSYTEATGDGPPKVITIGAPAILDQAYPVTYSGNTTDSAAAEPIVLAEGTALTSQISLHAVPAVTVTLPSLGPQSSRGMGGRLSAVGPGGIPIFVQGEFRQRVDGDGSASEQEITGVAPGTYQLNRQTFNDSGEMSVDEEETVSVSSGGAVPLTQANTTRLHGRVVFTSGEPQQIALRFIGDRVRRMAVVQQDGAFTMPRPLPPGRYKLAAVGLPGLSVQSVSAANQASIGSILTIPNHAPGSLDLTVTVGTAATSTVSGVVLRGGKPLDSVMVLLLPSDFADTATIGRDQSDSDGTFSIANVQAGRYTLLALDCEDGAADLEYQNAAVMKPYLPHGQLVTIPLAADKPLVVEATACR